MKREFEFKFENRAYKIILEKVLNVNKVYVTLDGERINPFVYIMEESKRIEFIRQNAKDPIRELIDIAKADIENRN
jgi:hypothetical protein